MLLNASLQTFSVRAFRRDAEKQLNESGFNSFPGLRLDYFDLRIARPNLFLEPISRILLAMA